MTIPEIIGVIKFEKACVLRQDTPQCNRECKKCDLLLPTEDVLQAYDEVIRFLELRIPKPAKQSKTPRYGMGYEYYDWHCPNCGRFLAYEPYKCNIPKICVCGQIIDGEG